MSETWYDKFRASDRRRIVQADDPTDNWVQRTAVPERYLVSGDLTIEGDGGEDMTGAEILAALNTLGSPVPINVLQISGLGEAVFARDVDLAAEIARALAAEGLLAPIDNPTFTGVPTGPTAANGTNNTQLATTAFVIQNGGGGGGGAGLPVLRPENYGVTGAEPDANATLVVEAFEAMKLETESLGGAIWYLAGNYPINAPIIIPSNTAIIGIARMDGDISPSTIRGIVGNHTLLKFPYGGKNHYIANMNFAHNDALTPTAGVMWDLRWGDNFVGINLSFYNMYNGIDCGVSQSTLLNDIYMRGFSGTTSGIGTDVHDNDMGFGILIRSTQTLLDGNVGRETEFYDRDGSGVTVLPKSKARSWKLRGAYINGKRLDAEEDGDSVSESYNANFANLWSYGASSIRCENLQLREGDNALRVNHAPYQQGVDRDGAETGKNMASGNFFINISCEANKRTFNIGGYEKNYYILCQSNGSAVVGWDIGDNPADSFPGVTPGVSPVDEYGGSATFLMCSALTAREEGVVVRSGKNRFIELQVAGYSGNQLGDIEPGNGVSGAVTTSSVRFAFGDSRTGANFVIQNTGADDIKFTVGNSSVTTSWGAGTLVVAGGYTTFSRLGTDTHIAVIANTGDASTFAAGSQAPLGSAGLIIKNTAVTGTWINGGVFSANKSLNAVGGGGGQGPGIHVVSGANKFFIHGADPCELGILNEATTASNAEIKDLIRSGYRYSTYSMGTPNTQTGTSYTLLMRDNGNLTTFSNASGITLTVPSNATLAFPIGGWADFANLGAGTVTVAAAGGVTVTANSLTMSTGQGGRLWKTGTNTWVFTK